MENVIGLVMAAGTDDRMKSKKSKLAQELYGKAVIKRVVDSRWIISAEISNERYEK